VTLRAQEAKKESRTRTARIRFMFFDLGLITDYYNEEKHIKLSKG
jgi:hypothetical protein